MSEKIPVEAFRGPHPSLDLPANVEALNRLQARLDLIKSNSARRRRIRAIKREEGETFSLMATIEYIALYQRMTARRAAEELLDKLASGQVGAVGTLVQDGTLH